MVTGSPLTSELASRSTPAPDQTAARLAAVADSAIGRALAGQRHAGAGLHRRTYWLRVPPQTRTARSAVAWTFGLTPEQYAPLVQT
jgi:hypothetical protein